MKAAKALGAGALSFGVALALACASAGAKDLCPSAATGAFRPAASEAEKALDKAMRLSETDAELTTFLLKTPGYKRAEAAVAAGLFTPALIKAYASAEAAAVKRDCGGRYRKDEICGLDFDPVTCAQDVSDKPYLYRTDCEGAELAIIEYRWDLSGEPAAAGEAKSQGTYRMVQQGVAWRLDGANCGEDANFNLR